MSSLQYNQPGNLVSIEDSTQQFAPRSAMSMEEMVAMMTRAQFSNDAAAAAGAARGRRQNSEDSSNYTTASVPTVGGHRRNHE
ncbi:hypothetical protein BGX29_002608 [Mortierella sp. GBA35]|nr:hypothetical protein BGX23_005637 [Mortierella sp. AD031]KAF9103981.1 hypothetical protein BGX29_002608 [Mortierella sp. GBA35]KAG0218681.1 hypothetical protein BGX33_006436 [Mortierella sp. NVP41]